MEGHYTYLGSVIPDANWQKLTVAAFTALAMILIGILVGSKLKSKQQIAAAIVPPKKIGLFGLVDLFFEQWVKFQDSILGVQGRVHAPFTATIFFFILISNLLGLIPGVPVVTTTVWINVGMAFVVFGYFNFMGIKAQGLGGYLKHFAGPVWWLGPFIFCLEIMSTCLRILTLNLRLYWNISADHIVLGVFTQIVPFGVPVVFYALGTFVAFMQAFVFSLLTMVYIHFATHHEDHGHHEEHGAHA